MFEQAVCILKQNQSIRRNVCMMFRYADMTPQHFLATHAAAGMVATPLHDLPLWYLMMTVNGDVHTSFMMVGLFARLLACRVGATLLHLPHATVATHTYVAVCGPRAVVGDLHRCAPCFAHALRIILYQCFTRLRTSSFYTMPPRARVRAI